MKDFSKIQFYRIRHIFDISGKMSYVGSTSNWVVRKYQHKRRCNDPTDRGYNWNLYKHIRKCGGFQNFVMEEIERYPCNNAKECSTRELYWIEKCNARLNMLKPVEY